MSCAKDESEALATESVGHERGVASPPCFMHEADPTYFGYLGTGEVVALLNELLEGERAGARAASRMDYTTTAEPDLWATLMNMRDDEARFCAMLSRHIERLGAVPSGETGAFEGMVLAIEPGAYWDGGGGLRVEDNFLITAIGPEKLSTYPDDFR